MAEFVFILAFAVPAILGLAEIIHISKLWLLSGKDCEKKILIIVPSDRDFQKQLLKIYEEARWQGNKLAQKIIVVDSCLNDINKRECEILTRKFGFEICSKSELLDIVS